MAYVFFCIHYCYIEVLKSRVSGLLSSVMQRMTYILLSPLQDVSTSKYFDEQMLLEIARQEARLEADEEY